MPSKPNFLSIFYNFVTSNLFHFATPISQHSYNVFQSTINPNTSSGVLNFFFLVFSLIKKKLKMNQSRAAMCQWGPRNSSSIDVKSGVFSDSIFFFFYGGLCQQSLHRAPALMVLLGSHFKTTREQYIFFGCMVSDNGMETRQLIF